MNNPNEMTIGEWKAYDAFQKNDIGMYDTLHAIRQLIIHTPSSVPVSRDSEFIADMENLLREARKIAAKYDIPTI